MKDTTRFGEQSMRKEGRTIDKRDEGDLEAANPPLNCLAVVGLAVASWLIIYVLLTAALVLAHHD